MFNIYHKITQIQQIIINTKQHIITQKIQDNTKQHIIKQHFAK